MSVELAIALVIRRSLIKSLCVCARVRACVVQGSLRSVSIIRLITSERCVAEV